MTADQQFHLRVSQQDLDATRRAAKSKNMTLSAYVLTLIRTANEKVLAGSATTPVPVLPELVPTTSPAKSQLTQQQIFERRLAKLTASQREQVMTYGFYTDEDGDEVSI